MERGIDVTGPIAPTQQAAVEALLAQRELAPRQRERLEMVKAAWLGQEVAAIAQWSGRTVRTVRRWLTAFRAGGVTALAGAPIPGRPRKADDAYLAEQTGIRIAPGWLRVLLHRQHFACGRPKHTLHHLQDPEEVAACEAALQAAGGKGGRRAGVLRIALRG
jgi:Winged helix-turn helix